MRSPRMARTTSDSTELLDLLRQGGLLLLPTDTLFGLAARADSCEACERLAGLKGRDPAKALPVVFRDTVQLYEWIPQAQAHTKLIDALLPGALTLVLPGSIRLGAVRNDWAVSVGIRIPGACPASELFEQLPWPLALSSANLSGDPDPRFSRELHPALLEGVDAILPGEPLLGQATTVVDLRRNPPAILRLGGGKRESTAAANRE